MVRPVMVEPAEWGSTPLPIAEERRHTPRVITIHHAGVLWKTADDATKKIKALQSWGQRDKGWPDVPYHFLIAPDGKIFVGRDINFEPETNTKYSLAGTVNVHLWGHFDEQRVSIEQLRSTVALCAWLCDAYELNPAEIRGHVDAAPGQTTCPGTDLQRYVSARLLSQWVEQARSGKSPETAELPQLPKGPTSRIAQTP